MSGRQFKFSRDAIAKLPVPTDTDRVDYQDTEVLGFQLRVSKTGRKVYRVKIKKNGRTVTETIGPAETLSLTAARTKAKELLARMHLGTFAKEATAQLQPTVGGGLPSLSNPSPIQSGGAKSRREESAAPVRPVCV
jgi:hypothetical protein